MHDVNDLAVRSAILLEQAGNGFPTRFGVGDL